MAKMFSSSPTKHIGLKKKTSTSGKPSMVKKSSMNKNKKRSYKKYRGQGK